MDYGFVMLKSILPPVCLLLALALAVTGFSVIAFGGPEASVSLHEARASGDELTKETLEEELARQKLSRGVFITMLFVGSGVMTIVAFAAMGERKS